jgi:hypothetical protein
MYRPMRVVLLLLAFTLAPAFASAQQAGPAFEPSLGFASSLPNNYDRDLAGHGFHAKLEYVHSITSYFAWKPYAGLFMTWQDEGDLERYCARLAPRCEATSQIVQLGSKLRLAVPIPWLAPFIELGLGLSAGVSRTETPEERRFTSGLAFNLPFAFGVALGPQHSVEISAAMYQVYRADQFLGAFMLGFHIPLETSER